MSIIKRQEPDDDLLRFLSNIQRTNNATQGGPGS